LPSAAAHQKGSNAGSILNWPVALTTLETVCSALVQDAASPGNRLPAVRTRSSSAFPALATCGATSSKKGSGTRYRLAAREARAHSAPASQTLSQTHLFLPTFQLSLMLPNGIATCGRFITIFEPKHGSHSSRAGSYASN
jgi:hypothetical protein